MRKYLTGLCMLLCSLNIYATQWIDPDFDEAVNKAGLICVGLVEKASPQKTTIRIMKLFKGVPTTGSKVTIFRSTVVGVGHDEDQLPEGHEFLFIVDQRGKDYAAFTDSYWVFYLNDTLVSLPIRDPSAYVAINRQNFETFLKLVIAKASVEKAATFANRIAREISSSDVLSKNPRDIDAQIFALESLSYFGQKQHTPLIVKFIHSPQAQVRLSCVRALERTKGAIAKDGLLQLLKNEHDDMVQPAIGKAIYSMNIKEAKSLLEQLIPTISLDDSRLSTDIMSPLANTVPPARYSYAAALMRINGVAGSYNNLISRAKAYLSKYQGLKFHILENRKTFYSLKDALQHPDDVYILNLANSDYSQFPEDVRRLKHLKCLRLGGNKIQMLPDYIINMELIRLDLDNNALTQVPKIVYSCTTLEELHLGGNNIQSISADISNLKNLKNLSLRMCDLDSLPDEFAQLQNLEKIDLYGNDFYKFPVILTKCNSLKTLLIGSNKIKRFPLELSLMKSLENVDISYNELSNSEKSKREHLPAGINIDISGYDRYYSIDEALQKKEDAATIHDNHNDYSGIAFDLSSLTATDYLLLTYDNLSFFPGGLTSLSQLKSLSLSHNNITEVPADINRMKGLTRLDVSFNKLSRLPSTIKELPLKELLLSNNNFSAEDKLEIASWFEGKCKIYW